MATPDFVIALREHVGHRLLPLVGVTAVVLRADEVLLVRRADDGRWAPVSGVVDPGEEPADAGVREVLEEAAVVAEPERLCDVHTLEPFTYGNGDEVQYLDLVYRMRWVAGEPRPADGENLEARWFPTDQLPELTEDRRARVLAALEPDGPSRFRWAGRTV